MKKIAKNSILFAGIPIIGIVAGSLLGMGAADFMIAHAINPQALLYISFFLLSGFLTLHGLFTLVWMLYAWEDPESSEKHKSPKVFTNPYYSFTALVPVRHEERVVRDTLRAINAIDYPTHLKEIIVLCRVDDVHTIQKVREVIEELGNSRIRLEIFNDDPINKPHALNKGLLVSDHRIIGVFDAEDEPHSDIYNIINTILETEDVDVVQSGVQLMNYRSHWFSALNCMEYYFWFKSGLHFFSRIGKATPLGGNTVFFKKHFLEKVGGWDEFCLTEDADIGLRLIKAGAKVRVVYDEKHTTREETPHSTSSFIKQRTRWNQGFLQILSKYDWATLPKKRQKFVISYILLSPLLQALLFLYLPVALFLALTVKLPIVLSLFSFVPFFLFFLQLTTLLIGLYEFTKSYNLKFPIFMPFKMLLTFYPYQLVLALSSVRALYRFIFNVNLWEKTVHTNAHRDSLEYAYAE